MVSHTSFLNHWLLFLVSKFHSKWHHRLSHFSTKVIKHHVYSQCFPMFSNVVVFFFCVICWNVIKVRNFLFYKSSLSNSSAVSISQFWCMEISYWIIWWVKYNVLFVNYFTQYIWFYPFKWTYDVFLCILYLWWKSFQTCYCFPLYWQS